MYLKFRTYFHKEQMDLKGLNQGSAGQIFSYWVGRGTTGSLIKNGQRNKPSFSPVLTFYHISLAIDESTDKTDVAELCLCEILSLEKFQERAAFSNCVRSAHHWGCYICETGRVVSFAFIIM